MLLLFLLRIVEGTKGLCATAARSVGVVVIVVGGVSNDSTNSFDELELLVLLVVIGLSPPFKLSRSLLISRPTGSAFAVKEGEVSCRELLEAKPHLEGACASS